MARAIWATVHGLASIAIALPESTEPHELDLIVELSLAAISAGYAVPAPTGTTRARSARRS